MVALLDRFPALTGVDLEVAAGDVVLLKGPNGAGKTTLLRLLAGLVPVAAGRASVLGIDLGSDRTSVRPMVGLLGHASGLYDELTVLDNVRFWARAAGVDPDSAAPALDRVGSDRRLAGVRVDRLSTGQRRRASLAAMLVRRPRLWLLDEPHAGLDADGRDLVDDLVADATRSGVTVVFASHEMDRAESIAGRVVTLVGGAVVVPADVEPGVVGAVAT